MAFLVEYGIWGLFVSAFLAATVLPFSSEVILGVLLAQDVSPGWALFAATSGNVLGAVVNYGIGLWGGTVLLNRVMGISEQEIQRARERFQKYGTASLLFAWVPVVGDPLTVAAGILKVHWGVFLLLVGTGKLLRYVAVIYVLKLF